MTNYRHLYSEERDTFCGFQSLVLTSIQETTEPVTHVYKTAKIAIVPWYLCRDGNNLSVKIEDLKQ